MFLSIGFKMDLRNKVAREAARLLYTGVTEEYIQAKNQAAKSLGISIMPSNYEVAIELDILADELEGKDRTLLIVKMRLLALEMMKVLNQMNPRLKGSVWRGTTNKNSDIDIEVISNNPNEVRDLLEHSGYKVTKMTENVAVDGKRTSRSTHILIEVGGIKGEIILRPVNESDLEERCDIYGDVKRGISLPELEKLMKSDSLRKFVPRRRYR
jgi:predicted nucleotidyltransferase